MPVTVFTGQYCAGKTTAMRKRRDELRAAGIESVTVDYDDIAVAFGSSVQHGHADHFTTLTQRVRGLAIKLALEASRNQGTHVLIVDASPTEARWQQYRDAAAEVVTLAAEPAELHRRADAERPPEWHRYIDEWTPTREHTPERKVWPKRPGYRKATASRAYAAKRKAFLADKTNCQHCGVPFVLDAPCTHPSCRRTGRGCHYHPHYPTVQHTLHLADGSPSMDETTWEAWAYSCNSADGGAHGWRRKRAREAEQVDTVTDLDW